MYESGGRRDDPNQNPTMRFTQRQLGREFQFGETKGKASNVHIEDFPNLGLTALIGYGHAVYATREKDTGTVEYFAGWYDYSQSTKCQLKELGLSKTAEEHDRFVDVVHDERLSRGFLRRGEKSARREESALA